jgi:hypothetical protein
MPPDDDAPAEATPAGNAGLDDARAIAEIMQKVYLAVGKVITADEARALLNRAGAGLSVPNPEVPFAMPSGA